eukprot:scaffold75443_cov72-Attheya_sp.AAC.3
MPPADDEFVYGGLGDTTEIRATSLRQMTSFHANEMYKRNNRKRKKNEPAQGPCDMFDAAVRKKKMSLIEKCCTDEVNAFGDIESGIKMSSCPKSSNIYFHS